MSDSSKCPSCGTELPPGSVADSICPACLLERGLLETEFFNEEEGNDEMTNRARDIFARAYDLEAEERDVFLSQECGEDAELRHEIEQMLASASQADSFIGEDDEPTLAADGSGKSSGKPSGSFPGTSQTDSLTEKEGDIIGSYKLLQQIGEGGFGTVWMAEQSEPISRKVALKVIKAGMDTKEVLTRFEAERQAVALMDHPNIAKVLDAGATDSGRPWFAMELVKGIPVTQFCDEQKLNMKQRLALFSDICSAINHAHQKGVIHRDIKPSNVMVTLQADKPVVKVIDFGIAKATHSKLTEKTLFTRFEQFMGTPAYMSPEQAGLSGLDIDTRSDIYSLGVLLYELLAGRPPFDPKTLISAGYEEMRRIIREVEPSRPSHYLTTTSGEDAARITGTHGAEPNRLSRLVKGELDWIVMKAIEKDRSRRYETANAFAADIGRYLTNEPVHAAAPSAAYKFRKFARRNKAAFGVAAAMVALLLAGIAATSWQAVRATAAQADAEAISTFLTGMFERAQPGEEKGGIEVKVVEILDQALGQLEAGKAIPPKRRARLQWTLANTYQALGLAGKAIPLAESVRDYHLAASGLEHPGTLMAMNNLANSYHDAGRREEALALWEQVLELRRKVLGEEHPETLMAMNNLAASYHEAGRLDEALELWQKVLELRRKVSGEEHPGTLMVMNNLAASYLSVGRFNEYGKLIARLLLIAGDQFGVKNEEEIFPSIVSDLQAR